MLPPPPPQGWMLHLAQFQLSPSLPHRISAPHPILFNCAYTGVTTVLYYLGVSTKSWLLFLCFFHKEWTGKLAAIYYLTKWKKIYWVLLLLFLLDRINSTHETSWSGNFCLEKDGFFPISFQIFWPFLLVCSFYEVSISVVGLKLGGGMLAGHVQGPGFALQHEGKIHFDSILDTTPWGCA